MNSPFKFAQVVLDRVSMLFVAISLSDVSELLFAPLIFVTKITILATPKIIIINDKTPSIIMYFEKTVDFGLWVVG